MKILVTGGAGYIGALLCPRLLAAGHKVTLLDSFLWGVQPVLHFAREPSLEIVKGDVRDLALVSRLVPEHDVVLHLAAIVGYPACAADPELARATNFDGTRHVAFALGKGQRLVFASTGSTYGAQNGTCTEETPINPLTVYGRTKRDAEKIVLERGGICLRFATVFGLSPRLRLDLLVNDFCYQAVHNGYLIMFEGGHRRTFLHSSDAAESYLFCLEHADEMAGQVFNVGGDQLNFTKREVAERIGRHVRCYLHEAGVGEDQDKRDYTVSYEKIRRLGFRPAVGLDDGIREMLRVMPHIKVTNPWRNA